jgi:hypothetical protein
LNFLNKIHPRYIILQMKNSLDHDIDENMPLQRRIWRLERVGWVVLILFVTSIFIGLFGDGPLSQATMNSPDKKMELKYSRYARVNSLEKLIFKLKTEGRDKPVILIEAMYFKKNQLTHIMPAPESEIENAGYMEFHFNSSTSDSIFTAIFSVTPLKPGSQCARVGADKNPLSGFSQFIYP